MGNCLLYFFSFFDCYDTLFRVQYNGRSSYKTSVGAAITLIVTAFVVFFGIFVLILLLQKGEETMNVFDEKHGVPPQQKLYYDNEKETYKYDRDDMSFFFPMVFLYNQEKKEFVDLEEASKYFYTSIRLRERLNNGTNNIWSYWDLVKCSEFVSKFDTYDALLHTKNMKYAYCFKPQAEYLEGWDQSIPINGEYNSYQYLFLQSKLIANNAADLQILQSKYRFYLGYSDYSIKTNMKNKPAVIYSLKNVEIPILTNLTIATDFYISQDQFKSKDDIFNVWKGPKRVNLARVNRRVINIQKFAGDTDIEFISFVFRSEFNYKKYYRTYKTFFFVLGQFGGFWKCLLFFGSFITTYNAMKMNIAISNKMYNLIDPANNKEVMLTYDEYMKLEKEVKRPAPLLRSMNPVLREMAFDYYKFERNRGLKLHMKEFLFRIFCSWNKKGEFAEKEKMLQEADKAISDLLDMNEIAKFSQRSKALKNILLSEDVEMLGFPKFRNLNYKTLYKLGIDIDEQKAIIDYSPMALTYYKQRFLLNGLTSMRNQTYIYKKDILTLALLKFDRKGLETFFVNFKDKLGLLWRNQLDDDEDEKKKEVIEEENEEEEEEEN